MEMCTVNRTGGDSVAAQKRPNSPTCSPANQSKARSPGAAPITDTEKFKKDYPPGCQGHRCSQGYSRHSHIVGKKKICS